MIPVKLELENFISHIYSVIDFTKFNFSLIVGSYEGDPNIGNGIGKTALLDGIRFALYGKGRFDSKSKMVKRGKEHCQVCFEFILDGETYKIIRKLNARSGILSVIFSRKDEGKWESKGLTCDTPSQTNDKIIEIIKMNHDTFVNVVYFRQNDIGFASANVSKRKEILKEALQIGIWDEYQKVAKINEKNLTEQLSLINERIKLLGEVEEEIVDIDNKIKNKNELLKEYNIKYKDLSTNISKLDEIVSNLEIHIAKNELLNRKKIEKEIEDYNSQINIINKQREKYQEKTNRNLQILKNIEIECNNLYKQLILHYENILIVNHRNYNEINVEYKKYSKKIITSKYSEEGFKSNKDKRTLCRKTITELELDLKHLLTLSPGKECPTCLSKIDDINSVVKKRTEKQRSIEKKIKEQNEILKAIDKITKEEEGVLKQAEISVVEAEKTNLIIAKKQAIQEELNNEIIKIKSDCIELENKLNKINKKSEELTLNLNSLNNIKELIQKLEKCNVNKKQLYKDSELLKENIIKTSVEQGNLKGYREELERRQSEKRTLLNEENSCSSKLSIYSKLSVAFGKDGIQSIILENITEDLRQYTNSILKRIYYKPVNVDFITQRQTTTGSWKEDFDIVIRIDNEVYNFEDLSGGEQIRLSVAVRLALSFILMKRIGSKVQCLFFDEIDSNLDKSGIQAFYEIINELSKDFKILVISHNDYMKDKFENIIEIRMNEEGSRII
jgi:exonuclease SbcC